ncbi:hypothetical protein D3C80_1797750 [compost metagenome]
MEFSAFSTVESPAFSPRSCQTGSFQGVDGSSGGTFTVFISSKAACTPPLGIARSNSSRPLVLLVWT